MGALTPQRRQSEGLRREINARNAVRAVEFAHELGWSSSPSVVYCGDEEAHGNFYPAAWRNIQRHPAWLARLDKVYTASRNLPRSEDRTRGELECATSSDALLMNIFCTPSTLSRRGLQSLLGLGEAALTEFGWRARLALNDGCEDRTEIDMRIGDLLVEAKLCEGDFQNGRIALMQRYPLFEDVFDVQLLAPRRGVLRSYQLLRSVLVAAEYDLRFAVMIDARRHDLIEDWFAVLRAVRWSALRSRLQCFTWQEMVPHLAKGLRTFLAEKYGVVPQEETRRLCYIE